MATIPSLLTQKREPISGQRIFAFTLALSVHAALLLLLMLGGADGFRSSLLVEEPLRSEVFVVQQPIPQKISYADSGAESKSAKPDQSQTKSVPVTYKAATRHERVLTPPIAIPDGSVAIGHDVSEAARVPSDSTLSNSGSSIIASDGNGNNATGQSGQGQGAGSVGLDSLLAIVSPAPQYPVGSLRNGEQGEVVVLIRVDADGKPISAEVVQSSGYKRLDQAMLRQVLSKWRYQPAIKNGRAVEAHVLARQKFVLGGVYPDM